MTTLACCAPQSALSFVSVFFSPQETLWKAWRVPQRPVIAVEEGCEDGLENFAKMVKEGIPALCTLTDMCLTNKPIVYHKHSVMQTL